MNKTTAVLALYDEFRKGRSITLRDCCDLLHISVPTFRRYIALLRVYFMERYGTDIVYNAATRAYSADIPDGEE